MEDNIKQTKETYGKMVAVSKELIELQNTLERTKAKEVEIKADIAIDEEARRNLKKNDIVSLPIFRQLKENHSHHKSLLNACRQAKATFQSAIKIKQKTLSALRIRFADLNKEPPRKPKNLLEFEI